MLNKIFYKIFNILVISVFCQQNTFAVPYIPINPNQVLEKLPTSINIAPYAFNNLRTLLSANPNDLTLATKLAKLYIERSREEGDPRYLGYAQATLLPWWKLANPPIEILVLRATLLQSTHHFDQSLVDLDTVLKLDHANGQAWITRATILQVQGKYAEALKSCEQLDTLAPALIMLTCTSNVRSLSGQAVQSYKELKTAYAQNVDNNPDIQVWVLTLLAEMASRIGDDVAAENYFVTAINIENPDSYLLGAYADFLLDKKRPQEVITLLKTKTRVDPLLLRYAEALSLAHSHEAATQIQVLKQTFAAAVLRGDTVHQREQSRFELRLMNNSKYALVLAKLNWKIQKEPADARVYLEAAIATGNQIEVATITNWIKANKQEDVLLKKMVATQKYIS